MKKSDQGGIESETFFKEALIVFKKKSDQGGIERNCFASTMLKSVEEIRPRWD